MLEEIPINEATMVFPRPSKVGRNSIFGIISGKEGDNDERRIVLEVCADSQKVQEEWKIAFEKYGVNSRSKSTKTSTKSSMKGRRASVKDKDEEKTCVWWSGKPKTKISNRLPLIRGIKFLLQCV